MQQKAMQQGLLTTGRTLVPLMSTSPMRIGIVGPIGSGKSYLAGKLELILMYAQVIPFAKALKDLCNYPEHNVMQHIGSWEYRYHIYLPERIINMLRDAFERYPNEPGVKNRKLLQYVGTEVMRNAFDPNIWITAAEQQINRRAHYIIHDDVRFANEAATLDFLIEVQDPDAPADTHYSESREWSQAKKPDYYLQKGFAHEDISRLAVQLISRKLRKP